MHIVDLQKYPEYLRELAEWHQEEWADLNPGEEIEGRIARCQKFLREHPIPRMFVGLEENQLLGTSAIVESDMDTRPELTPWLASVYVKPERRGEGLGIQLVLAVMDYGRNLGLDTLYLYTPDAEKFYQRLGWQTLEKTDYQGEPVTLMQFNY